MPTWTPAQADAITARGADLIVAAAAGSGKTAVLVERVLSLLREGVDIGRMLVVTFTNAAADEMRERLLTKLEQDGDPAMQRLAARVERAHIRTLHGFCKAILREEFAAAGVDPAFRVADPSITRPLLEAAADAALDELLVEEDAARAPLDALCGGVGAYRELIMGIHAFVRSLPSPQDWLARAEEALAGDDDALAETPWARSLARSIAADAREALALLRESEEIADFGGCLRCAACAREDAVRVADVLGAAPSGMNRLARALGLLSWPVWPSRQKQGDPESKKAAKDLRDRAKKLLEGWSKLFSRDWPDHCQRVRETAPTAMWLGRLVLRLDERYAELKARRLCVDYDDLEHLLLHALQDPATRARVSGRFDAMFVDECQDISRVQQALIEAVAPQGGLFQVGDVKQSIYRFRNADPGLFLAKQKSYRQEPGAPQRRIDLSANYRSRPAILRAVNRLFETLMTGTVGEIDYADGHALTPGRDVPEGPAAELHILAPEAERDREEPEDAPAAGPPAEDAGEEDEESLLPTPAQQREAQLGAALIAAEIGQPMLDPRDGRMRPTEPRDIVVLLRAPKSATRAGDALASLWMSALEQAGLTGYAAPATLRLQGGVSDRVLSLLRVADNPRDDDAMIAALRTMGIPAADLAAVAAHAPSAEFGDALRAYLDDPALAGDPVHGRLAAFWARRAGWTLMARTLPAGEAVRRILEDALDGPAEARFWAQRLADESPRTALGEALGRLLAPGGGGGDAPPEPMEDENVVRVMSIHQSKGSQFPVVLVAGLSRDFRGRDAKGTAFLHRDLGLAAEWADANLGVRGDTLPRVALRRRLREETRDEEMRLLYVAMTRAQEKLLLVATCVENRQRHDRERWAAGPSPAHAVCAADWVVPVAASHPDAYATFWHEQPSADALAESPAPSGSAPFGQSGLIPPGLSTSAATVPAPRRLIYRYEAASRLQRKASVTHLAHGLRAALPELPENLAQPRFLREAAVTPAQRGEATHALMRMCDPQDMLGKDADACYGAVRAVLDAAVTGGSVPAAAARCVPIEGVAAFWASSLGQRAAGSPRLLREAPFVRPVPACELEPGLPDDAVLVQGVVDLAFLEGEGWVLVDFKTDAAHTQARQEEACARHAPQLRHYAAALQAIDGRSVAQAVLWLVIPAVGLEISL